MARVQPLTSRANCCFSMFCRVDITSPALAVAPQPADSCALPFATRTEWLAFVGETPDGDAAATHYAAVLSTADYAIAAAGLATLAHRIPCHSSGRRVNGIIVAPHMPGPHPVIVFNHGGVMQSGRIIDPESIRFHRRAAPGYIALASTHCGEADSEGVPSTDSGDVDYVLAPRLPRAPIDLASRTGLFARQGCVPDRVRSGG